LGHFRTSRWNTRLSNCAQRNGALRLDVCEVDASSSPATLTAPDDKVSAHGFVGGGGKQERQRERLAKMPWYLTI